MHIDFASSDARLAKIYADMHGLEDDLELTLKSQHRSISISLRRSDVWKISRILEKYLLTADFRKHRMPNSTNNEKEEVMPTKQ